ncbi:MAG: M50 family metallopeptidase [Luteimonas sp.]|nr:M50 family metallopeptidase [Luteimonas sp.]
MTDGHADAAIDLAAFGPPPAPPPVPASTRKAWLKFALTLPLFAIGGAIIGGGAARLGLRVEHLLPDVAWWWALGFAVLATWPHIVLHEAGHALAGLARGMRPVAFGIGSLRWDRGESGWRFRRSAGVAGISGFAALLPVGERGLSRTDQSLYLLGGPLANLLTAAVAFALLPLADGTPVLAAFLLGSAASALLLGVANLVPFHSQGWRSDGRGLLDLARRTPDAALQRQLNQLLALNMAGVRPRDWPAELVPQPVDGSASPMLAVNGDILRLSWAMDLGDATAAAEAARHATRRFHTLPEAFRPHLAITLAGHVARHLRDRELLAAWRPLCEGGITDLSLMRAWLDAELAALAGDPAALAATLASARSLLDRAPDPVTALLLREYLDDLGQRRPG